MSSPPPGTPADTAGGMFDALDHRQLAAAADELHELGLRQRRQAAEREHSEARRRAPERRRQSARGFGEGAGGEEPEVGLAELRPGDRRQRPSGELADAGERGVHIPGEVAGEEDPLRGAGGTPRLRAELAPEPHRPRGVVPARNAPPVLTEELAQGDALGVHAVGRPAEQSPEEGGRWERSLLDGEGERRTIERHDDRYERRLASEDRRAGVVHRFGDGAGDEHRHAGLGAAPGADEGRGCENDAQGNAPQDRLAGERGARRELGFGEEERHALAAQGQAEGGCETASARTGERRISRQRASHHQVSAGSSRHVGERRDAGADERLAGFDRPAGTAATQEPLDERTSTAGVSHARSSPGPRPPGTDHRSPSGSRRWDSDRSQRELPVRRRSSR